MAQRACAVVHSSGACAIEGAQAVSAQISAQMELSYTLGFRGAPLGFRGFPLGFHAALLSIFRKKFYNPRPIAAKSAGYSSLPRVPRVFCGGSGGAAAART